MIAVFCKGEPFGLLGLLVATYLLPMYIRGGSIALFYAVLVTLILGVSALLYKESIPERFAPGLFDNIGNSHNIMHVGILIAYILEHMFIRHA